MARTKTYQHFCPVARSLEVIGEKWSLLIVRDLLRGPMRFTDLSRTLGNITPKWLTQRLRDLEAAGIVERDTEEGRREVYYRLTPKGRELAPVVGALNVWGMRHAMRLPEPGEAVNPPQLVTMFSGFLVNRRVRLPGDRRWLLDFGDDRLFEVVHRDGRWSAAPCEDAGGFDVRVVAAPERWAEVLALRGAARRKVLRLLQLDGPADRVEEFADTIEREMG